MNTQPTVDLPQKDALLESSTNSEDFTVNFSTKEGEHKKGPLEFMWTLIQRYEVDIFKVSLKRITSDFFDYMQKNMVALEQKSAFSKMAARLIFYKSRYLLPNLDADEIEDSSLDRLPDELIDKLLEYKKMQVAAENLGDAYALSSTEILRKPDWQRYEANIDFFELDLVSFLKTFQQYLLKEGVSSNQIYRIDEEEVEVEELQKWLHKKLISQDKLMFFDLVKGTSLVWIICLFLATLEMIKWNMIKVSQMKDKNIMIELI